MTTWRTELSGETLEGEPIIGEPFEIGREDREPWQPEPPPEVLRPEVLPPPPARLGAAPRGQVQRPHVERLQEPLEARGDEKARRSLAARLVKAVASKAPANGFLALAGSAVAASLVLKRLKRHHDALFVGQWAPTLLLLGLYRKIAETHPDEDER